MTDIKVPASGNIRVWWALENAFNNFEAPTAAEINEGCLDISDSISWNDFDFALQASNTIDDPAITAIGKVSDRGAAQFGGGQTAGGKTPSAPQAPTAQPNLHFNLVGASGVNQLAAAVGSQFNQPIRAYVVGSEVNSAQEMERKRIRTASFG
jgi:hypothetical protein